MMTFPGNHKQSNGSSKHTGVGAQCCSHSCINSVRWVSVNKQAQEHIQAQPGQLDNQAQQEPMAIASGPVTRHCGGLDRRATCTRYPGLRTRREATASSHRQGGAGRLQWALPHRVTSVSSVETQGAQRQVEAPASRCHCLQPRLQGTPCSETGALH